MIVITRSVDILQLLGPGDPDFLGKFPVHFDDTETLIFSASNYAERLIYPELLNAKKATSVVATKTPIIANSGSSRDTSVPFTTGSISLVRAMVAGVSDDLIDINQKQRTWTDLNTLQRNSDSRFILQWSSRTGN